jgi:hypothetical protein
MSRYPSQPLEEKLAWLRERMRAKAESPESRSLSPAKYRRRKRLAVELPKHLRMFRVVEVAEMLGVSSQTVRRWFKGRVVAVPGPKIKFGRRRFTLLISQQDLEEFIEAYRGSLG